jgi:hypothetical protein
MPLQVKRLLLVFALFVGMMIAIGYFLTPASFYQFGHYRGEALTEIANKEPKYVDVKSCTVCHDSLTAIKDSSVHKSINCQTCHGVGNKHVNNPKVNSLVKPDGREDCGRCHSLNPARLASAIKQVDLTKHNVKSKCVKCHNPHSPGFKTTVSDTKDGGSDPAACLTCHSNKNQEKMKGKHNSLSCQSCHGSGDGHIKNPTKTNITKSNKRDFCGKCHGGNGAGGIKQIDLKDHNPENKCIDCHKAHNPLEFKNF